MSALPPKADIETQSRDVRFVPKADIGAAARHAQTLVQKDYVPAPGMKQRIRVVPNLSI